MDYSELLFLIKKKGLILVDVCKEIGITPNGFRKGIESGSLALRYIKPTCEAIGISPNELFNWENVNSITGVYASNISGINNQNSNEAIMALKDELKEQRAVIKDKDKQIKKLMSIIEKWEAQ